MSTNLEKRIRGTRKSWVSFKGKTITLDFEPRKGICSNCGKKDAHTHLHHTKYDENDPLANTVELCASCHIKTRNSFINKKIMSILVSKPKHYPF